eukprot:CAMPEP_0176332588 /NCGR_PEP_ID=MMETSP0121_2-20121125/77147_1 /TAXON_ID=160619 /ORGANISM="Kryptoperidinium foliaceum, Strain CCMP 1326" /LENGTH=57 /DNA_ID=CAMNT_0017675477 /DNA_START=101 /DNA_END=274 /DNA_ORIENTATION=-
MQLLQSEDVLPHSSHQVGVALATLSGIPVVELVPCPRGGFMRIVLLDLRSRHVVEAS